MKQLAMTVVLTLVFGLAALAQTATPSDPQSGSPASTPSAAPSAQPEQSPAASPSAQQPSAAPSAEPSAAPSQSADASSASKGEKKLKGCIQSEGGKFILQEKNGKTVELTGSDVSAHVGHTVTVHGTPGAAAGSSASLPAGTGTPSASSGGEQFNVTKIDMVSESCSMDKSKSSEKPKGDSSYQK